MSNSSKRLGHSLEHQVASQAQAKGITARLQPISGQLVDFPGDVALDKFLIECKVRAEKVDANGDRFIHLDTEWVKKVVKESKRLNKRYGIVCFRMKSKQDIYTLIRLEDFLEIIDSLP